MSGAYKGEGEQERDIKNIIVTNYLHLRSCPRGVVPNFFLSSSALAFLPLNLLPLPLIVPPVSNNLVPDSSILGSPTVDSHIPSVVSAPDPVELFR